LVRVFSGVLIGIGALDRRWFESRLVGGVYQGGLQSVAERAVRQQRGQVLAAFGVGGGDQAAHLLAGRDAQHPHAGHRHAGVRAEG
jgi:hypothetical protein